MFQVLIAPGSKSSLQNISLNSNKQKICFGNHGLDPCFFPISLERSGLSLNCFSKVQVTRLSPHCCSASNYSTCIRQTEEIVLFLQYAHNLMLMLNQKQPKNTLSHLHFLRLMPCAGCSGRCW